MNYFVSFIDHYSHFAMIYLLHSKDEVEDKFKHFVALAEAKFNRKIENLRCDQGGEYISATFKNFCANKGINMQYAMVKNASQNGVAERFNRTILDKARCILFEAGMEREMWGEAVLTSVFLYNRTKTTVLPKGVTPAERWYGFKPNLDKIKIFGCPAYVFVPKENRVKLDSHTKKMNLIGYCDNGYRLWDPHTRKIVLARNVIFNEFWKDSKESDQPDREVENVQTIPVIESDNDESIPVENVNSNNNRRSKRERQLPKYLEDFEVDVMLALSAGHELDIPDSYEEAIKQDEGWRTAVSEELTSLEKNGTWKMVKPPPDATIVDSRWIFTEKTINGVKHKKARLVARGYQQPALDGEEIFAPVARMITLRVLLSIAVEKNFHLQQLDVKSAFLRSPLNEVVFMKPPDGLQCYSEGEVCMLIKAMYGLRQSPKCWNEFINLELIMLNFKRSKADPCLYFNGISYILIWVDDLFLVSSSVDDLKHIKQVLMSKMEMHDLSSEEKLEFLGLSIVKEKEKITVSQTNLIQKVLKQFNMLNCKISKVPIQPKLDLKKEEGNVNFNVPFKELIGSLMYIMLGTRPDLCFSVSYFGRFQNCYNQEHWTHLKNVLRYLKYSENVGLVFVKNSNLNLKVKAYVDSDFASDSNDRKSVTGYVIKLNDNLITWCSKKQSVVALSSCEAEYYALTKCMTECLFLRNLLLEIYGSVDPINVYEDNQATIKMAQTYETKRSKHIDLKYYFIRDLVMSGKIKLLYVDTNNQLADVMTKALSVCKFEYFCKMLNLLEL